MSDATTDQRVIVITGASSGIGRAAAQAFARRGNTVVLAARSSTSLEDAARACRARGGSALAVPTDTTDRQAIDDLARRSIEQFGRLDVWINNAAVSAFGRFETTPPDVFDQVVRINLLGYANGARSALRFFRQQRRGVLINVSSQLGMMGAPHLAAYVASKFGIIGLTESLRLEHADDPDIHVCLMLPGSIDTPIFQHAANFTGRALQPLPPIYRPETVAEALVRCADDPRAEMYPGRAGLPVLALHELSRSAWDPVMRALVQHRHFQPASAPDTTGNLFNAQPEANATTGGWRRRQRQRIRRQTGLAALAGLTLAALWWLRPRPREAAR